MLHQPVNGNPGLNALRERAVRAAIILCSVFVPYVCASFLSYESKVIVRAESVFYTGGSLQPAPHFAVPTAAAQLGGGAPRRAAVDPHVSRRVRAAVYGVASTSVVETPEVPPLRGGASGTHPGFGPRVECNHWWRVSGGGAAGASGWAGCGWAGARA